MWMMRRFLSLAMVPCLAIAEAGAQAFLRAPQPQFGGRLILDGYVSQYDLALAGVRARLDGVGARVMVALARPESIQRQRLAEHFAVGGFIGSTSEEGIAAGSAMRTTVYGVQLDVRPLRAPVAGLFEPVLSLGAGAMRVEETHADVLRLPDGSPLVPRDVPVEPRRWHLTERATHPILAPSVGLLLTPSPGFALRLDARSLLSNGEGIGRSSELAAGVSITL